ALPASRAAEGCHGRLSGASPAPKRRSGHRVVAWGGPGGPGLAGAHRYPALLEHFAGYVERVHGRGETRVDGHLQDDFDDLGRLAPDIERAVDVDLELWRGGAHRGERGYRGELAGPQVQPGSRHHVPVGEGDDPLREVGGDVLQALDDRRAGAAGDGGEGGEAEFAAIAFTCQVLVSARDPRVRRHHRGKAGPGPAFLLPRDCLSRATAAWPAGA